MVIGQGRGRPSHTAPGATTPLCHSILPSPAGPQEPLAGPPRTEGAVLWGGCGSLCEASCVLSWLSLWAPGPRAILGHSHVQMWLARFSVDGTQAQ